MKRLSLLVCLCLTGCVAPMIEKQLDKLPRGEFKTLRIVHGSNLASVKIEAKNVVSDNVQATADTITIDTSSPWTGQNIFFGEGYKRLRRVSDPPR